MENVLFESLQKKRTNIIFTKFGEWKSNVIYVHLQLFIITFMKIYFREQNQDDKFPSLFFILIPDVIFICTFSWYYERYLRTEWHV